MKKTTLLIICFLSVLNISAEVYSGQCGENARFTLDTETGVLSITGTGAMTNYYYSGSAVWSSHSSYIKAVDIVDGITTIGDYAFSNCSGLTTITIPNSVTSIGSSAFYNCSGLTSITIPNSVTLIAYIAFSGCYFEKQNFVNNSSLDAVTNNYWGANIVDSKENGFVIKDGELLKYIGNESSITIPNSVTSIGSSAFYNCPGLSSIIIPNSVTSIGSSAFYNCSGLSSIIIPNSVTSIGGDAFSSCSSLASITIPNSVISIGGSAFLGTAWYDNQPDGLIYAGRVAYKYKGTMPDNTSFSIKEGTVCIASSAFWGCSSLTSIEIPNSVTEIGSSAFSSCSGLTSISIPNSVTSIGHNAFGGCSGLTSVTIPNSVTSLENRAFYGCYNLKSVTINSDAIVSKNYSSSSTIKNIFDSQVEQYVIGDNVTSIGDYAFIGCTVLTSFDIPNSVTSIGKCAFNGCTNLTTVSIGSNIQTIGERAFANIDKLNKFTCYSGAVPTADRTTFENSYINYVDLYVPSASVNEYKNKAPWREFGSINALSGLTQCATPTIDYVNGELTFSCETEDVEFVYDITSSITGQGANVALPTKTTYIVKVYATKEGYEDSNIAMKEISIDSKTGIKGDVNEDGTVNGTDIQEVINIIVNGDSDDDDNNNEPRVRFGFYETIPGYSVTIDRIFVYLKNETELCSGIAGSVLSTTSSNPTWDKKGDYTTVSQNENKTEPMHIIISYHLTADDGSGETISIRDAQVDVPAQYLQWQYGRDYNYLFKISHKESEYSEDPNPVLISDIYPISLDNVTVVSHGDTTR